MNAPPPRVSPAHPHAVSTVVIMTIIGLHAALALHAAWNQSPAWDEVAYPAAGYDLWREGRVRTNLDHPPLGKALLALPYLGLGSRLERPVRETVPFESLTYGFDFLHRNAVPPPVLIVLPRLISVLCSCALAFWIFHLASRRWGAAAGWMTLVLYAVSPPVLSRASLALLEMPLAFFILGSMACYASWQESSQPSRAWGWVLFWMAAALTKATAWILLPAFFLADQLGPAASKPKSPWRRSQSPIAACVVLLGCEIFSRSLGSGYLGPQILARQASIGGPLSVYFHGQVWDRVLPLLPLLEWMIKTPVSVMVLATMGLFAWYKRTPGDPLLKVGVCAAGLYWVQSLILKTPYVTSAHAFWFYPWLCIAGGGVVNRGARKFSSLAIAGLGLLLVVETALVHPQHGAYASVLVGGSSNSYRWVADSDQDWGQGLPSLAAWMRRHGQNQILLAYSGAGDPRVYGIGYQDVFSPALVSRSYRGEIFSSWPDGLWLALGTKVAQSEPDFFGWLLNNRRPRALAGLTFLMYELTSDREAREWLSTVYRATNRPQHAASVQWAGAAPPPR